MAYAFGTAYIDIGSPKSHGPTGNPIRFWNTFPSPMKVSSPSRAISKLSKKLTDVTILAVDLKLTSVLSGQLDVTFAGQASGAWDWCGYERSFITLWNGEGLVLATYGATVLFCHSWNGRTIFVQVLGNLSWYQVPDTTNNWQQVLDNHVNKVETNIFKVRSFWPRVLCGRDTRSSKML
jgi:hypothetical protein